MPFGKNVFAEEKHFKFNGESDPESLDPAIITGVTEMRFVSALFEGLVNLHPETLKPLPGVAEKWSLSEDGLVYTFYLRKNAKWSDGSEVSANDFYYAWKRVLTPKTASSYAYQLYPIKNAESFHRKKINDFSKVGVQVIDSSKFLVTLERPCPYFLELAAFPTLYPVNKACIEKYKERWIRPENIVSNGAFSLEKWDVRQRLVMIKHENYWDKDSVKLSKVTGFLYDDLETAYKLFLQKKLHWLPSVPLAKMSEIMRHPDYYVMPYLGTYFYRFNCSKEPFNNVKVRKALSMVIDRNTLTNQILKGGEEPATHFCPPVSGYQPVKGIEFNIEKAKTIFSEAGYGPGKKTFPEVELLYNTSDSHKKIAEYITEQWAKHLNIKVKLRNTEWKVFLSEMNKLNFDLCRSSWIGDYGDPNTFFDMFVKDGGNNRTGWFSKEYDSLLLKSLNERDQKKRFSLFQKMERILVEEELPIIPLYIYVNKGMLDESITGWYENVLDLHPLKYIDIEEI